MQMLLAQGETVRVIVFTFYIYQIYIDNKI